jgi:hypothetical protein
MKKSTKPSKRKADFHGMNLPIIFCGAGFFREIKLLPSDLALLSTEVWMQTTKPLKTKF